MDDKTKLKIMAFLLGFSVSSGSLIVAWDVHVSRQHRKAFKKLHERVDLAEGQIQDYRAYIQKILEVTAPSPEQIEVINRSYDFYKWDTSLKSE